MNYYRHHIGDYLRDTAYLSMLEDAAYRRLLDVYYMREAPLPADTKAVARIVRARANDEISAVETVLAEFFTLMDDGWHQKRADAEIVLAHERADKARTNGKSGGRPQKAKAKPEANPEKTDLVISGLSKQNPEETDPVISGLAKHNPEESSPSPIPQYSVTNVTDADAPPDERDLIWSQGVRLLVASGVSQSDARSFLGGQVKARGSPQVARAVTQALIDKPVEPKSYIAGVANAARNQSGRPATQDRSAAGRVRANVERARAEREAGGNGLAVDVIDVRPSLDVKFW